MNGRTGGPPGPRWLRYGAGLYFSRCSGKSNDYTQVRATQPGPRSSQSVPHHSMLLCKVALGRNKKTLNDDRELTKEKLLNEGYDSISGNAGVDLNFPEDVIFDSDAALPSYLITYCLYD